MGIELKVTPEKLIRVAKEARAFELERFEEEKKKTIAAMAKQIAAANGFLWWRAWTGKRLTGAEAIAQATERFEYTGWDAEHWYKHLRHEARLECYVDWENLANASDTQTITFTGDTAKSIASWLKKD
jgi:hypothetical protein